jgi:hypothetical protein
VSTLAWCRGRETAVSDHMAEYAPSPVSLVSPF